MPVILVQAVGQADALSGLNVPVYEQNGQRQFLIGFRAHGSAEALHRFKEAVDVAGWPNMTVADAGEPPFLSVPLKNVSKDAFEALVRRAQSGEFGAITFESMLVPAASR